MFSWRYGSWRSMSDQPRQTHMVASRVQCFSAERNARCCGSQCGSKNYFYALAGVIQVVVALSPFGSNDGYVRFRQSSCARVHAQAVGMSITMIEQPFIDAAHANAAAIACSRRSITSGATVDPIGANICIEGWRGINHSIAIVNQNQILELLKCPTLNLFHSDVAYPHAHWNTTKLDAGFGAAQSQQIAALPSPDGAGPMDICLRLAVPVGVSDVKPRRRRITFLVTEFGPDIESFLPGQADVARYIQGDDIVITPSTWAKERLIDYGFPVDKVQVVPHGFKTDIFMPQSATERQLSRQSLGILEHEVVFSNVGVATWNKGTDLLILAYAQLRNAGHPVRLLLKDQKLLYGIGIEEVIKTLAREHPIVSSEKVLSGVSILRNNLNQEQLRSLYSMSDAYVSPYRGEGFNLPALEAMASGTYVVVTGGGATDDFVSDRFGYKLKSRPGNRQDMPQLEGKFIMPDYIDLYDKLEEIAENPAKFRPRDAMMDWAYLAEHHSWAAAVRKLVSVL